MLLLLSRYLELDETNFKQLQTHALSIGLMRFKTIYNKKKLSQSGEFESMTVKCDICTFSMEFSFRSEQTAVSGGSGVNVLLSP